jgi:Zn-finger nucleic acid-binding protein
MEFRRRAGESRMNCLNCDAEMNSVNVVTKKNSISYDACPRCGSLWLDSGELDKMAFQVEGSIEYCEAAKEPEPEAEPKKCPRCEDSTLDKVKFLESDEIFLHRCANCGGFWLDGNQLNLIDEELARIMPVKGHGFSDFVNNVHVPYWFQRVQKPSHETDVQVAVMPLEGAEMEEEITADTCPHCGTALNEYSIFEMTFEGCPKCKGVWLIQDELRELKNKVDGGSLRWMNDEIDNLEKSGAIASELSCPKGHGKLVTVVFGNSKVVVDWCPSCKGVWLDRGGFDKIVDYLEQERGAVHPAVLEKQLAADLRKVWKGAPEGRAQELRDAGATLHALINATIFEHPDLFRLINSLPQT